MQELSILPAHIVKYTLGLFCNLNFSFDIEARKKLEEKFDFSFDDVENLNVKENLIIELKNKQIKYVDFKDLQEFARPACFACRDFSNVYADISFGGLGSKDGYTTAIIRTEIGEKLYNNALKEGYLQEKSKHNTAVLKSEMLAKVISFGKRKFARYKKSMDNKHLI